MFLKLFRKRSNQKYINKILNFNRSIISEKKIISVGIILSIEEFKDYDKLKKIFTDFGINENRIKFITYVSDKDFKLNHWDDYFNPEDFGDWYKSVGSGMGASLNISASIGAYILSDRASWLNFKNKSDLEILFSDDKLLLNQYSFIPINPIRHDHVESKLAEELENWLTSDTAKSLINGYEIGGQALFKFNAKQE